MIWRTGRRNPHTLYLDEGDVSIPQGFIMNPGAARAIAAAMNHAEPLPPPSSAGRVAWSPELDARARALIERADRGEGRQDVKTVVEYLRSTPPPSGAGRSPTDSSPPRPEPLSEPPRAATTPSEPPLPTPRPCECRQPDCHACELAGTKEWLLAQGLHVVTAEQMAVLKAMADVSFVKKTDEGLLAFAFDDEADAALRAQRALRESGSN